MSGIALIIPGADFSNSPLGHVTFSKTIAERAAEAVEAYATAIGSHAYDDELNILVYKLMKLGVWETISVFPMLGDTVAKKVISLNRSEDTVVTGLAYPETVTIDNNELLFTNAITSPTIINGYTNEYTTTGLKQGFSFADLQRGSDSINTSRARNNYIVLGTTSSGDGVAKRIYVLLPGAVHESVTLPISLGNRHSVSVYINSKIQVYVDSAKEYEDNVNTVSTSYAIGSMVGVGGSIGRSKDDCWDGYIRMVAYGTIKNEVTAKSTIDALQEFLNVVKPRS